MSGRERSRQIDEQSFTVRIVRALVIVDEGTTLTCRLRVGGARLQEMRPMLADDQFRNLDQEQTEHRAENRFAIPRPNVAFRRPRPSPLQ